MSDTIMDGKNVGITLGPVLCNWPVERLRDYYFRVADEAPVDHVHIGEAVCEKRNKRRPGLWDEIAERLETAGKKVTRSSLILFRKQAEYDAFQADLSTYPHAEFEANDFTVAHALSNQVRGKAARPFSIGPFMNVYNEGTLSFLVKQGAYRVCLPVEVTGDIISKMTDANQAEIEVFVLGRAPLSISARCFSARAVGKARQGCQFACANTPDGLTIKTLDGENFLTINGPQALSFACYNIVDKLPSLIQNGVRHVRISPEEGDLVAVSRLVRSVLDGDADPDEAALEFERSFAGKVPHVNGFYHGVEGDRKVKDKPA